MKMGEERESLDSSKLISKDKDHQDSFILKYDVNKSGEMVTEDSAAQIEDGEEEKPSDEAAKKN